MQVITIASRKGGVGKTTLATHLSVLASTPERPALLIDTDPQRSLTWWRRLRPDETPLLVEGDARELPDLVKLARRDGIETIIVDTPPHNENSIAAAMRIADLILVPTRPGPFDLAAVASTLELAKRIGKQPLAVLNAAPPRTSVVTEPTIVLEARETLVSIGATVARSVVAQRVSLSHAIISGKTVSEFEPQGRAAAEIALLWREVNIYLEMKREQSPAAISDQPRRPDRSTRPAA
jgi:chromosome partitioning protein